MAVHVAIVRKDYLKMLLAGRKTVESRLSRQRVSPYGQICAGERIYFKASGGPFMATARVRTVTEYSELTPARIDQLQSLWNAGVAGDPAYWSAKRCSRYASFITLSDVEPSDHGPVYQRQAYRAWYVLPDEADPVREIALTPGAIRNRYLSVAQHGDFMPIGPVTLELTDGRRVETHRRANGRLQWRGWAGVYNGAVAGDRVRIVRVSPRVYRVTLEQHHAVWARDTHLPPPAGPTARPGQVSAGRFEHE